MTAATTVTPTRITDDIIRDLLDVPGDQDVHAVCPTCSPDEQSPLVTLCGVELDDDAPGVDRDVNCAACIVRTSQHHHGRWSW